MHKTSEVGLKFMFYFILFSYSFKFMFWSLLQLYQSGYNSALRVVNLLR